MEKEVQASSLTNGEKSRLLQGTNFMYTHAVPRLNLPALSMADGPHGLRKQIGGGDNGVSRSEPATAFPTASCLASSWDPAIVRSVGRAIGEECRFYGVHLLLGPGVNLKRNPLFGRNFEYYSEDPLLSGSLGAAFIRGVQDTGVSACVKHFALNNQENFRFVGNSVVDERAMRELYLKCFETVIREGQPGAVMSSYTRINGVFASESSHLLTDLLRREWGFNGLVMSDWGGTHDRIAGIRAGEDLEMPGDTAISQKQVFDALEDGSLCAADADACLDRLIAAARRLTSVAPAAAFDRDGHAALAVEAAVAGAVLMKNEEALLPLNPHDRFCVIGELFSQMRYQGSGSSMITPTQVVTHKDAFEARGIRYEYAPGYSAGVEEADEARLSQAIRLAQKYDTILLYLGLTDLAESEGGDRPHMRLPEDQLRLVTALTSLNKKIVVVLSGGSPVELPFINAVSALLNLYLPGQCGGEAGTRLLFGEAVPSGKLAETWYRSYADVPYGSDYSRQTNEQYKESIYVGYRYTRTAGVKPAFPFGHGLSYTRFSYENLRLTVCGGTVTASLELCNTGSCGGAEIVQLYVKNNADSAVFKADAELLAFTKVYLAAGEQKSIELSFPLSDLAFWNCATHAWTLENGTYTVEIGASSEDILLREAFSVTSGASVSSPYPAALNETMRQAGHLDDAAFAALVGYPLPSEPALLPLTLESRFCDFRHTFWGRILYGAVCSVAKSQLRRAKKLPAGPERDNRIKGALFLQQIFDTNCVRTLSLSAGTSLPWNIAEGFVLLGNGHLFRSIAAMCHSYTIKGAHKK